MRNEPTELNLINCVGRSRLQMRRPERIRPVAEHAPAEVLDAAFDEYSRVDAGPRETTPSRETRGMTKDLIADIAAQLSVLDRQREQLAALLRGASV